MMENTLHIKFQNRQNPRAEFDSINLGELFRRENLNHSPFQHHLVEFYMIIFIESGKGLHTIDFTEYSYEKGTILTIRKDQIHMFHKNPNVEGTMLLFTDDFLASYLEKLEALKALQLFNEILSSPKIQLKADDSLEISNLLKRIEKEYFDTNDDYSLGIIRSELHILIANLFRLKSQKEIKGTKRKYLNDFIELQNLVEKNAFKFTKVKDYARLLGVSTKTINNITHNIVNKSAKAFVDEICIKQIKRLLVHTDYTVKEIAYDSGFEETTNFYKYFKRQTNLTPEAFRTSIK